ncbi:MAG TPA: hypothetical protein VF944_08865 [Candidatus Bathyarchaeia archaeon]
MKVSIAGSVPNLIPKTSPTAALSGHAYSSVLDDRISRSWIPLTVSAGPGRAVLRPQPQIDRVCGDYNNRESLPQ